MKCWTFSSKLRTQRIQKKVDDIKNRKMDRRKDRNAKEFRKNMCRIPGHNHEWKDCQDNPRNAKKQENHAIEKECKKEEDVFSEEDDYYMEVEPETDGVNAMDFVENDNEIGSTTQDNSNVLEPNKKPMR